MANSVAAGIVGVGNTEFSANAGRPDVQLAVEAVQMALADAGLTPKDVDGIIKGSGDASDSEVMRALGIPRLRFHADVAHGGMAGPALITNAAAAIARGHTRVVVVYHASSRSGGGGRRGGGDGPIEARGSGTTGSEFSAPYGMMAPVHGAAMAAHRYIHDYNISEEDFASAALVQRAYAQQNPNAMMYKKPLDLEGYLKARWIAYPFRLNDCSLVSEGAVACVIVAKEMFRSVKPKVVAEVLGGSQTLLVNTDAPDGAYRPDVTRGPAYETVDELFGSAGLTPKDVDVAGFYEAFAHHVYAQLEGFGYCGAGEGPAFVKAGQTGVGGTLPVNTSGGHMSEAHMSGSAHLVELVRQLRGTALNQVKDPKVALFSANGWANVLLGRG